MSELNQHPIILAYIEHNAFGKLLDMHFSIAEIGVVNYQLKVTEKHLATPSSAHGGLISALLDATLGIGALSVVCNDEKVVSTVEMKVTFLSPAKLGDELIAKSVLLKAGKRLIFMEGDILNGKGVIVAKASGTFNAYPKEKAGY